MCFLGGPPLPRLDSRGSQVGLSTVPAPGGQNEGGTMMDGSPEELIVQWQSRAEAYRHLSVMSTTQPSRHAYEDLATRCEDVARSMASRHRIRVRPNR